MFATSCHVNDGQTRLEPWQLTMLHLEMNVNSEADVLLNKTMLQIEAAGVCVCVCVNENHTGNLHSNQTQLKNLHFLIKYNVSSVSVSVKFVFSYIELASFSLVGTFIPLFLYLLFMGCRGLPVGLPKSSLEQQNQPITRRQAELQELLHDPHYFLLSLSVRLCMRVCVCVCTGCFHIWSLSCVFLWAHSHAMRNLSSSLFLQTPLLLLKPPFPVRARQKVGLLRTSSRELASKLLRVCDSRFWYVG